MTTSSNPPESPQGPNAAAVGQVAAEHLGPILYALEVCAASMEGAGRLDDTRYYRALARELALAGGQPPSQDGAD